MSDYIPNPPNPERDPRNYDRYYEDNSGKGVTLVVGILVAIALAAGLMFFAAQVPRKALARLSSLVSNADSSSWARLRSASMRFFFAGVRRDGSASAR